MENMFEVEQEMQAFEEAIWNKYQAEEVLVPSEEEPCTGCDNGCDQCLDPLMAGYAGCYHKDGVPCDCAEQYRLHETWVQSSDDSAVCTCRNCQSKQGTPGWPPTAQETVYYQEVMAKPDEF